MHLATLSSPAIKPFLRLIKSIWPFSINYMSLLILFLSFPLSVLAASSPMVERHIFSPTHDSKGAYKSPMSLRLEKTLMFTGVVISSQGKWAIIRESGKMKEEKVSGLHKEGDEIMGMVIKKIANNFLILIDEGKEVRLNLYQEGKSRPSMPMDSESPSESAENVPTELPSPSSESPHSQTFKTPANLPDEKINALPPIETPLPHENPPNPFLKQNRNPFLKEPATNPSLPKTPPNSTQKQPPNTMRQ